MLSFTIMYYNMPQYTIIYYLYYNIRVPAQSPSSATFCAQHSPLRTLHLKSRDMNPKRPETGWVDEGTLGLGVPCSGPRFSGVTSGCGGLGGSVRGAPEPQQGLPCTSNHRIALFF